MIKFENISKAYAGETLLDNISFKVNKGERCGLVGRNGTGKTTLLKILSGEESPDSGSIDLPKNYSIGYLSQHLHLTQETVLEEAALGLRDDEKDLTHKVEKILFGLGFKEDDLTASPSKFSGGYQLRIHLAKVLVQEPDCLLLDEPTNYLDIVSIRWFTNFLRNWKGELLVISHDRDFMDLVTTHTIGIHRKKILKLEGGTEKFYAHILHEEEVYERTRQNLEKKRAHLESFITRFGAKATKATQAQARAKALAKMPSLSGLAALHNLDFNFPYANFPGQRLVEIENVSFDYANSEDKLIQNFSLTIDKGDRIAIIGKNGRGKSTLLKLVAQELMPMSGTIKVANAVKTGFFGQTNIDRLDPQCTIEEEIQKAQPHLTMSEVRGICGVMMFTKDKAEKPIKVLSGGEKSRVLLGKILVSPCNLLLLDEPTNHLDMESIEALVTALDEFEGAVVIVTHSEMILRQLPTKFVICHKGQQHLFVGSYEEFLEKEGWEDEVKQSKTKTSSDDWKIAKRKKAELVNLRSKTLQPLQKKIASLESSIMKLEEEVEGHLQEMLEASQSNDGLKITTVSKIVDDKKKKIELLFDELHTLSTEFETKKAEYDSLIEHLD